MKFQTSGYRSKSLVTDVALGIFEGVDNALWCYAFGTVLFAGVLLQFLPLIIVILLVGWALITVFVSTTSAVKMHIMSMDEQAIVILSAIGALLALQVRPADLGTDGLATMLAVMSLTSVIVAACFFIVGHFQLTRLLELLPYPVICGFMAGIGWLLLEAGVAVASGENISPQLFRALAEDDKALKLVLYFAGGLFLLGAISWFNRAWALPAASAILIILFYTFSSFLGLSHADLVERGWLFDIATGEGGVLSIFEGLSLSHIDGVFLLSVMPQIFTIAFLALLSASMSLSALMSSGYQDLVTSAEMKCVAGGNVLCSMVCCPPIYTDVIATNVYERFGASSRWMPLVSALVLLVVAVAGGGLIAYMPKLLVGATIFLFAFQTLWEWMYENVRGFQPIDYAIVCIILGTVIFVGFMPGILVGILLALLLFVMRYSMISAVHGTYSLADYRSSVERSAASNRMLDQHGNEAMVYTLRGFLFFGTANAILDRFREDPGVRKGVYKLVLLDLKRVTGIDISALNTFVQIRKICESSNVQLLYSGIPDDTEASFISLGAVSHINNHALVFSDSDYAVEYMEDILLERHSTDADKRTIAEHLVMILGDREKADVLVGAMERIECRERETLFHQGDPDDGLYILEEGSLTAFINTPMNGMRRVKKFRPGAVIGEMSAYTPERIRTATIIASEHSVLYHLTQQKLAELDDRDFRLVATIHELVARTLGGRISYMNRRLMLEMR
jgi:SulP family sulfate permease